MTGLLLLLSGPLQSWGTNSAWNRRDTHAYPTRSGLIGLLAAVDGLERGEPLEQYNSLQFTIRIDRPGQTLVDFHTVGGGRVREETPPLAGGGRRALGKGTIVSHRHYLADAAFTVAVTSDDEALLDRLATKLLKPVFTPYLGRRSCPPTAPLFLGRHKDPVVALQEAIPLARTKPRDETEVAVDFVTERPLDHTDRSDTTPTSPFRFGDERSYQQHTTWRSQHRLPASLCAGYATYYLDALGGLNENVDTA